MRRRRFSFRQRQIIWWSYTFGCLLLYFSLLATFGFSGEGFLIAFMVTFLVVGAVGLVVKWLTSL
jgi:cytochrome c oxidase assembly factor CtaG